MVRRTASRIVIAPYTILIDVMEQHPFTFAGLRCDSDKQYRPLLVRTATLALGPAQGDYQLAEFRGLASVERKSVEDLYGTILGFTRTEAGIVRDDGRRERFERELETLSQMEMGAVVVEGSEGQVFLQAPEWGRNPAALNAKILSRSIDSYRLKFRNVQWVFADTRSLAELKTHRLLAFYYKYKTSQAAAACG